MDEFSSLIETIFSTKDEDETIRHLFVNDAQTFIDVIDEVRSTCVCSSLRIRRLMLIPVDQALDSPDLPPRIRKKCLKLLYRVCGRHALLPSVSKIPICYDRTGIALYRGGFADVWKGEYCGRDVAVKVIRTY